MMVYIADVLLSHMHSQTPPIGNKSGLYNKPPLVILIKKLASSDLIFFENMKTDVR